MPFGNADIVGGGIDAGDMGAQPRQRLGEQAAAAADIEQAEACERADFARVARVAARIGKMLADVIADIGDAHGVEFVQRAHGAFFGPPFGTQPVESGDIGLVHRAPETACAL